MAKLTALERLAKLQREAEQMAARLDQAKAIVRDQERKNDTHRKAVLGGLVIKLLREGQPIPQTVGKFLRMVTREHDRKVFEDWTPFVTAQEIATPKEEPVAEAASNDVSPKRTEAAA